MPLLSWGSWVSTDSVGNAVAFRLSAPRGGHAKSTPNRGIIISEFHNPEKTGTGSCRTGLDPDESGGFFAIAGEKTANSTHVDRVAQCPTPIEGQAFPDRFRLTMLSEAPGGDLNLAGLVRRTMW